MESRKPWPPAGADPREPAPVERSRSLLVLVLVLVLVLAPAGRLARARMDPMATALAAAIRHVRPPRRAVRRPSVDRLIGHGRVPDDRRPACRSLEPLAPLIPPVVVPPAARRSPITHRPSVWFATCSSRADTARSGRNCQSPHTVAHVRIFTRALRWELWFECGRGPLVLGSGSTFGPSQLGRRDVTKLPQPTLHVHGE